MSGRKIEATDARRARVHALVAYLAATVVVAAIAACAGPGTNIQELNRGNAPIGSHIGSVSSPVPLCSPSPTYTCAVVPFDTTGGFGSLPPIGGFVSGVKFSRNQFGNEKIVGPTVGVGTILPPGLLPPFPGPTPLLFFTEQTPVNVSMGNVSSFTVTLPSSVKTAHRQFYISFIDPNNMAAGWQTMADMVLGGATITFEPDFKLAETWQTGQVYGFAVFEQPNPSPLPTGNLYYTQLTRIIIIKAGLNGNNDVGTVSGPFAQLSTRGNTAFDSSGNFYVANIVSNNPPYVNEFAAGTKGDVPPIRTISGADTLLQNPNSVAVDSGGDVYVADNNYINIYSPGASGDATPHAQILIPGTSGVAFDSSNDLYVQHGCGIEEYAPGVVGTPAPIRCVSGGSAFALDAAGDLYACSSSSILEYSPTGSSPFRTISGKFTNIHCDKSIAVGSTGYIYLQTRSETGGEHVLMFSPTASGNAPFLRKIHTTGSGYLNLWPNL